MKTWTAEQLCALDRDDGLSLFHDLGAPAFGDITGELAGHVPLYAAREWRNFVKRGGIGDWLGKGYQFGRYGDWQGQGYNLYRTPQGVMRRLRFAWTFGNSVLDQRPALIMNYRAFKNWAGANDLIDEVRMVQPGLFLGVYYTSMPVPGFTPRSAQGRSAPEFFVLEGPIGAWIGADRD